MPLQGILHIETEKERADKIVWKYLLFKIRLFWHLSHLRVLQFLLLVFTKVASSPCLGLLPLCLRSPQEPQEPFSFSPLDTNVH